MTKLDLISNLTWQTSLEINIRTNKTDYPMLECYMRINGGKYISGRPYFNEVYLK